MPGVVRRPAGIGTHVRGREAEFVDAAIKLRNAVARIGARSLS